MKIRIPEAFRLVLTVVCALATLSAGASEFYAYYTKVPSGEPWERHSRTGRYADVVVHVEDAGELVFWRASSYLPLWKTAAGEWYLEEMVPRRGDGDARMPDRMNRFSYVRIIENTPEKVVVHWRYFPDLGYVDWDGVADEYFDITPDGKVTRRIRQGTKKFDDWNDPANVTVQTLHLKPDGIEIETSTRAAVRARVGKPVPGSHVVSDTSGTPVAHWHFDEGLGSSGDTTTEEQSGVDCEVSGHKTLWKVGVSGTALAFDGYHSAVLLPAAKAPEPHSQLTVEAWVALGAYPFEWAPIIHQAVWEEGGYYFGVDSQGHLGFHAMIGSEWYSLADSESLDRFRWYHVAVTVDTNAGTVVLYVDGKRRTAGEAPREDLALAASDVMIGLNSQKMPAVEGRIRMGKWPSLIGFDGLIDEVKIYEEALDETQVARSYEGLALRPDRVDKPDLMKRSLPANPGNKVADRFGAAYTRLDYYDMWDNMWRVSEHPDVVVNFDRIPTRFVFWRGLSHSVGLVTENGKWAGDQSSENYKELGMDLAEGCCEHMSDKQCRHAHVKIIENTDARVVVHWRYGMVDSRYIFPDVDEQTGWGDWGDEYWTIYPDAVAVRHLERGWIWADSWVETMFYSEPGTMPEDNIELAAYTMVDLDGETETYSWEKGSPEIERDAVISMINMKSEYHPYNVYPTGSSVEVFPSRKRLSHFPWWNHYPVSQIVSDGRSARAADRAAHSSLVHGNPSTNYLMYGLTNQPPAALLPLARSWNTPPQLMDTTGCQSLGYRPEERAYHLTATAPDLSFKVHAFEERPLVNPCFVIKRWGSDGLAQIRVEGEEGELAAETRQGIVRDTDGTRTLVVWLGFKAEEAVRIHLLTEG